MKIGKELDMENQKDQQQEQTIPQESLQVLQEEQLQDVTGAGGKWLDRVLSCLACGGKHLLSEENLPEHLSAPNSPVRGLARSSSSHNLPVVPVGLSDSPVHGVVNSSPVHGLVRSSSMPAK
jgi:hypothetical protein